MYNTKLVELEAERQHSLDLWKSSIEDCARFLQAQDPTPVKCTHRSIRTVTIQLPDHAVTIASTVFDIAWINDGWVRFISLWFTQGDTWQYDIKRRLGQVKLAERDGVYTIQDDADNFVYDPDKYHWLEKLAYNLGLTYIDPNSEKTDSRVRYLENVLHGEKLK